MKAEVIIDCETRDERNGFNEMSIDFQEHDKGKESGCCKQYNYQIEHV